MSFVYGFSVMVARQAPNLLVRVQVLKPMPNIALTFVHNQMCIYNLLGFVSYRKKLSLRRDNMTRDEAKKILGENATEEQVTNLLNSFHNSEKSKNDEIANLKSQIAKQSDYEAIKKQLDDINKANMSEQEKLEEEKKEIAKNLAESRIIVNTAKAKEILAGEEIDDEIIASLVSDNLDNTVAKANKMKQTLTALRDNVSKQTKEQLTQINLDPSMSNVNPNKDDVMTIEKFNNLSADEQEKFINEHPTEFENL